MLVRKLIFNTIRLTAALTVLAAAGVQAQEPKTVPLPKPQITGGKPLMQALNERMTRREFSPEILPQQMLANLLWAAFGVNRPDGRRTAPSASNMQELDVYAVTADGVYLYDAKAHALQLHLKEDLRAATGSQAWIATAPLNLLYVADYSKMGQRTEESKRENSGTDSGFIAQNVYLFCASEGLATVVRGGIDRPAVEKALKLRPDQHVVLAQTVGYPPKK
jgi:SagB-type dehydrogenase family enzyme